MMRASFGAKRDAGGGGDEHEPRAGVEGVEETVEAKEGFAAASSRVGVVVLETVLDEGLIADGLFREVLSKIQARRKDLQLDFAARIKLVLSGDEHLIEVCRERAEQLKKETLTVELEFAQSAADDALAVKIDGQPLAIEVSVADPSGSR